MEILSEEEEKYCSGQSSNCSGDACVCETRVRVVCPAVAAPLTGFPHSVSAVTVPPDTGSGASKAGGGSDTFLTLRKGWSVPK